MSELPLEFVEGAFFAICQRPPTNREMDNIIRNAGNKRQAIFLIKSLPEASLFFNHFYNLSFNWINSLLLIGEAPSPFQAEILIEDGVNSFVDVSDREMPYSRYLPDEVSYVQVAMRNDAYNGPEPVEKAAKIVLRDILNKRRVYVHCYSGISRSAAVASIVVGYEHGLPYNRAVKYVRTRRPIAQPHPDLLSLAEANELIRKIRNDLQIGSTKEAPGDRS